MSNEVFHTYFIQNNLYPEKCYVGMTKKTIESQYKGSGKLILKAIKKYGKQNFTRVDLGHFNYKDESHYWEGFYIKILKTEVKFGGYNISPIGGGTGLEGHHSDVTKKRISDRRKQYFKKGGKNWNEGIVMSEEFKEKQRKKQKGISYDEKYGPERSEEIKSKIGRKGHIGCDFKGEKNPMYGKKHTVESKQKMRLKKLGKKHTEETKEKMSISKKGKSVPKLKGRIPWNKGIKMNIKMKNI